MLRERKTLETPNEDYFVFFEDDDDLFHFHAYIMGPADSLYAHKFIKLKIDIPVSYPMVCNMILRFEVLGKIVNFPTM